ncbi:MAG: Cysteine desulfurase [Candidatus Rifleibacterium amylolyticum]|nr:MAG: Cysteine desulfurase [Candidatus Rifleibacterium amylolyticum]
MQTSAARYFDNAATSFPKPRQVAEAIVAYLNESGGSYGRAAYPRAFAATRAIERLRDQIAVLIGTSLAENIVFTSCATMALNTVVRGFTWKHKKVLHSALEHNAVMRPLFMVQQQYGIELETLPANQDGSIDLAKLSQQSLSNIDLVIVNHQCNVNGVIQPLEGLRNLLGEIPILVDASQSLGNTPVKADEWGLDFVAFTGHKSLLGPPGTGGLFMRNPSLIQPLLYGGTGSASDSYDMPACLPDRFEAGTPNLAGLHGLLAAIENKPERSYQAADLSALMAGLREIKQISVMAAEKLTRQGPVISIACDQIEPGALGTKLYQDFGIEIRTGLHCAPLAHRHLGTFPTGTARFALSPYHQRTDIEYLLEAVRKVTA